MSGKMVTIDLDGPDLWEIQRTWYGLERHGYVEGRISSGGEGVHLRIRGAVDETLSWELRRNYGDDSRRIWYDETYNRKPEQILFDQKGENKAGEWRQELEHLLNEFEGRTGKKA